MNLVGAQWRKSSYSRANDACVEVASNLPGVIAIRDSKHQNSPVLLIPRAAFRMLIRP